MIKRYKKPDNKRKVSVRSKLKRLSDRLRLTVFRSNRHIYGQIMDRYGNVKAAVSDSLIKTKDLKKENRIISENLHKAFETGKLLAEKAKKKKISKVYFDRGKYKYHGRIKHFAEGAREGGLKF